MEPEGIVERHPDARWRQSVRGVLVTAPGMSDPALLTAPGDTVWAALTEPCAVTDLVDGLAEVFDGSRDRIEADVVALLERLMADGLVRYRSPS